MTVIFWKFEHGRVYRGSMVAVDIPNTLSGTPCSRDTSQSFMYLGRNDRNRVVFCDWKSDFSGLIFGAFWILKCRPCQVPFLHYPRSPGATPPSRVTELAHYFHKKEQWALIILIQGCSVRPRGQVFVFFWKPSYESIGRNIMTMKSFTVIITWWWDPPAEFRSPGWPAGGFWVCFFCRPSRRRFQAC